MDVTRVVSGYGERRARRWLPGASAMLLIAGILPILVSDPASAASTITVNSTADGTGMCTLRDAITSANNNSNSGGCTGAGGGGPFTIDVPAGNYDLTLGELQVGTYSGASITISGAGAGSTTVHQTSSSARVFDLDVGALGNPGSINVAVTLSGLTISGGYAQGFGGGAILGGGTGDSLSLSGDVISGNGCSGNNGGAGLSWGSAGTVSIINSTFSNNVCGEAGGAVLFSANGSLTVSNSTFSGNQVVSAGGALFLGSNGGTATFGIDHSTFVGNQATSSSGIGGAIYLGSGTLIANTNRFSGNTAPHGGAVGVRGGAAQAVDDWWGCPGGPNAPGCDTADASGGTLSHGSWITLTNTPSPATVLPGDASTLTASVLQDSNGTSLTTADVATLIGQPVTWGNATHGTLSNEDPTIQATGTAAATLTQDGSCSSASASATVDNGPVTAIAAVYCPDLTATKTHNLPGDAVTGQSWTYTITIANPGVGPATFSDGQTVLTDNLATGLAYGTPVPSIGGLTCSIVGSDLGCISSGTLTITNGESFTVTFTANGPAGQYNNPRTSGICRVNPGKVVVESSYANNDCSDAITVDTADTTTTITTEVPDPSVVGESVPVDYSVAVNAPGAGSPTGNVTVTDGVDTCTGTVAAGQCTLTFSHAGSVSVTATYDGDSNFNASTSAPATGHKTNEADTSTTITTLAPSPSVVGQDVTIDYGVAVTAPGAGSPTGNVTVSDGTLSCTGSVAAGQCTITFTTAGTHVLTATYAGDSDFNGSVSTSQDEIVNEASTTTTITSDAPSPSVVGQDVTVTFSVQPNSPGVGVPTGNVTVGVGADSCTGTVAAGHCIVTLTTAGSQNVTATYAGDGTFAGSSSAPDPHQVNKAATTTLITSQSPDPSNLSQPVTVPYSVSVSSPGAGSPTGNVTVSDGVDSCVGTVAAGSCAIRLHSSGTRTLRATYAGDGNFKGSVSAGVTHSVVTPRITIGDFAYNSAALNAQLKLQITALAGKIKTHGVNKVLLTGYCNPGETCLVLSQHRASSVGAYLKTQLTKLRLTVAVTAVGGGSTQLVARAGSPLNRRVVASLGES
jgi:outer membrane protein OmpA-like peptidoglycan-associated protein